MILFFYSNFLAAILKIADLTVIGLYFSFYKNEDVSILY